jgi:hypothetical protein
MRRIFFLLLCSILLLGAAVPAEAAISGAVDPYYAGSVLVVTSNAKSLVGNVGQFFSASFQVTGGTAVYSWQVDPSNPLPPGLALSVVADGYTQCILPLNSSDVTTSRCPGVITTGQNVVVSGTPTQAGSFPVKFLVTDPAAHKTAVTFLFTVQAGGGSDMGITVTAPQTGEVWALGSTHTITWTDTTGSGMARNVYISLEPYVACLYSTPPCYIATVAPYTIANNVAGGTGSFTWTVPTDLASRYQGAVRVSVATVDGALRGKSGVFTTASVSGVSPVKIGFVDSVSSTKVTGWAFDASAQPTWVKLIYQQLDNPAIIFSQEVGPSVPRLDVEDWLKKSYGSGINTTIQQPLGFIANPSTVITTRGTYKVYTATMSQSGVLLTTSDAAKASFSIGGGATAGPISITSGGPFSAATGQQYSAEFRAGGGSNRGFAWQLASGSLPPGLFLGPPLTFYPCDPLPGQESLCPDNTERSTIAGTPTQAGVYSFQLKATDSQGNFGTASFTITVSGVSSGLSITAADALAGPVGQALSKRLVVSGGSVPYAWSLISGSLPIGTNLTFPTYNCIAAPCVAPKDEAYISGTPTQAGTYSFGLKATDAQNRSVTATFTFTVTGTANQGPIVITSPAAGEQWGTGKTYTIAWSGNNNLPVKITLEPYIACLYSEPACKIVQPAGSTIVESVTGTSYSWTVPGGLAGSYRVSLQTVASGVDYVLWGASSPFSIVSGSTDPQGITVTAPQKDESWARGQSHTIRWTPSGSGSTVSISITRYISCLHNSTYVCALVQPQPVTITTSAPDTGSYVWNTPLDFPILGAATVVVSNNNSGRSGESAVFQLLDAGSGGNCPIAPGSLVVGSIGTVYIITPDCHKYGFTSYQDFVSRGYKFSQVQRVDQSLLDSIKSVDTFARAAGVSFKYQGRSAVYYLTTSMCKQLYPSVATLRVWKVNVRDILILPSSEQYPDCTPSFVSLPENTPVRAFGDGTIYVVRTGIAYPFANIGAFFRQGFSFRQVVVVPVYELNLYPKGGLIE